MAKAAKGKLEVHSLEHESDGRAFASLQSSTLTRSFPWISALLALLCIAANASMFVGLQRMNSAMLDVAEGTGAAANATILTLDTVEVERLDAQLAFNSVASTTYTAVADVDAQLMELRSGVLAQAEALAATADAALRSVAVARARALFDALEQRLSALSNALQNGLQQVEAMAQVHLAALTAGDVAAQFRALSYVVDQLTTVGAIVEAAIELRSRRCVYENGGSFDSVATEAACINSTAPIALVTLSDTLRAVARARDIAARYVGDANATLLALRANLVPHGEVVLRARLEEMEGPLRRANVSALLLTDFIAQVAKGTELLAAVLASQEPLQAAVNENLDLAGNLTGAARSTLGVVRDDAWRAARRLVDAMQPPMRGVLAYGIAVALGALLYALSMQHLFCPFLDLDTIQTKGLQQLCFGVLYLSIDVFVVVAFLWMLAVTMLATMQGLFVSACWGVSDVDVVAAAGQLADIRVAVCQKVGSELVEAFALAVGGGTANFLLSYHLMASLQASYSKYVSGGAATLKAEGRRIDFNGDGQKHALGFDTVGDGKIDTVLKRSRGSLGGGEEHTPGTKVVV